MVSPSGIDRVVGLDQDEESGRDRRNSVAATSCPGRSIEAGGSMGATTKRAEDDEKEEDEEDEEDGVEGEKGKKWKKTKWRKRKKKGRRRAWHGLK